MKYYTECKRLGSSDGGRVFNDLYAGKGISRFLTEEHAYGKGCKSASMIGYMQTMEPDDILREVNEFASRRTIPSLSRIGKAWQDKAASRLTQDPLERQFAPTKIQITHYWIDLRHCTFDVPANEPPEHPLSPIHRHQSRRKKPRR